MHGEWDGNREKKNGIHNNILLVSHTYICHPKLTLTVHISMICRDTEYTFEFQSKAYYTNGIWCKKQTKQTATILRYQQHIWIWRRMIWFGLHNNKTIEINRPPTFFFDTINWIVVGTRRCLHLHFPIGIFHACAALKNKLNYKSK